MARPDHGKAGHRRSICASIALYNENRRLVRELYALRAKEPWNIRPPKLYLLLRAGLVLPVEDHSQMVRDYLQSVRRGATDPGQFRVVLSGVFCEQPPLNLIKSIELSGCYIVDDDFMLVTRWEKSDVATRAIRSPISRIAFLHHSDSTSPKYEPDQVRKGQHLVERSPEPRAKA